MSARLAAGFRNVCQATANELIRGEIRVAGNLFIAILIDPMVIIFEANMSVRDLKQLTVVEGATAYVAGQILCHAVGVLIALTNIDIPLLLAPSQFIDLIVPVALSLLGWQLQIW